MVAAAVALACSALTGLLLLPGTAAGVAQFELERPGKASAGLFTADGRLVRPLFSGRQLEAGAHTVEVDDSLLADAGSGYEIRVASSGAAVSYDWQGVIGNTGPLNGPGALKGLNPPLKIQIVGDTAVWGLGYNERQPSIFSFKLDKPQVSAPVSLDAFDRLYSDFATDGELVYIPNSGFPTSNSYYHMNETFTVAYNLSAHSTAKESLLCMHNFTDPGATTVICDTATSRPLPPFHCKTDGCISTSDPDTWLALDWVRKNSTFPAECNSNGTWHDHCYYTHAPTGITVARKAQALLIAHAVESPPVIRAFDKVGGRLIGSLPVAATKLSMAPDDKSFWAMLFGHPEGKIARYATPSAAQHQRTGLDEGAAPPELGAVTGLDTACAIAVHPTTGEIYVTDRKTQRFLVFPAAGGVASAGKPWGASLKLSFPFLSELQGGELSNMVCATVAFTDDGKDAWITDPGNRRIIKVAVGSEAIVDHIMFLTVQYVSAADWGNSTRVFSNFMEFAIDYSKPLSTSDGDPDGWELVHNWAQGAGQEYHAAIGLTHWSFAGFQAVCTIPTTGGGEAHTVGMVSVMPNAFEGSTQGAYTRAVELLPNRTLRPIADFNNNQMQHNKEPPYGTPDLHPDGSLRFTDQKNRNYTVIWRSEFDQKELNWTTWTVIANLSNAPPHPPKHGGGQGGTHPHMDVELPTTGPFAQPAAGQKLVLTMDANNNPNYTGFHLGSTQWDPLTPAGTSRMAPGEWAWTAMPGGVWKTASCNVSMQTSDGAVFGDTCVVEPDGSLDRCGGHFPCAANVAMTAAGHVIVGFNGEGWKGGQANQWLHYDGVTGLFLGQFGTVNGCYDLPGSDFDYVGGGYASPGGAGNSFGAELVTGADGAVYLYHNDESVHGGLHRWKITGIGHGDGAAIERVRVPL